jgi:YidC/Oxa1 family membrane protein insertase
MGFFEIFGAALSAFYSFVSSYGLAIILLTLLVRVILLPLSIKQTKSMREMQRIQPELKKLQQKHKGDRQKLNEEMMKLYKEHGVNPLGGCAPLLLQFPVLIGLFYVIRDPLKYIPSNSALHDALGQPATELVTHQFLGLRLDCAASNALSGAGSANVDIACGGGVLSGLPYLVLVLLMGFTTYYQQKQLQASRGPGDPQQQQMQMFMRIMPLMLMFFAFTFPSGVVIYWLTTNVWTIAQQRVMIHGIPGVIGGRDEPASAPPPTSTKKSGGKSAPAAKPKGGASTKGQRGAPAKASGSKAGGSSGRKRKR